MSQPGWSLGRIAGGSIRLWRGASRKPLAEAPDGDVAAIAEGIETALSVAVACPELRVLSCLSLGNMAAIDLPPAVATVVLCADNDAGNPAARAALHRAVQRFKGEGRSVRVAMPREPGADWIDGRGGGMTTEEAAALHAALLANRVVLVTDYADHGGAVERWSDPNETYPDCSSGCRWAVLLEGDLGRDWNVCIKLGGPRFGLLTFEHQAGHGCFERDEWRRRWSGLPDPRRAKARA